MIDKKLFKKKMRAAGYLSQEALAALLGIKHGTLNKKINGRSEFYWTEMMQIRQALSLSGPETVCIFFPEDYCWCARVSAACPYGLTGLRREGSLRLAARGTSL